MKKKARIWRQAGRLSYGEMGSFLVTVSYAMGINRCGCIEIEDHTMGSFGDFIFKRGNVERRKADIVGMIVFQPGTPPRIGWNRLAPRNTGVKVRCIGFAGAADIAANPKLLRSLFIRPFFPPFVDLFIARVSNWDGRVEHFCCSLSGLGRSAAPTQGVALGYPVSAFQAGSLFLGLFCFILSGWITVWAKRICSSWLEGLQVEAFRKAPGGRRTPTR
jgi:hypothetical protein